MSLPARINLVTLGVSDLKASTDFYERLGWSKSKASSDEITFFESNDVTLGLFPRDRLAEDAQVDDSRPGFSGITLAQNFGSEAEVDAAFEHAIACGATACKPPQKVFWGGYSGYFADPDGHLWELAHNPFVVLDDHGRMQMP